MTQVNLRNRVREARIEKGYSREELAQRVGITRQSISLIESGRVAPSITVSLRLARTLECPLEDLFWELEETQTVEARLIDSHSLGPSSAPARAYLGEVEGQIVARPAFAANAASVSTPAHGIATVRSSNDELARVDLLQNKQLITNTVFISGCDTALGLLANYAPKMASAYQGIWFNVPNQRAMEELNNKATHIAAIHYSAHSKDQLLHHLSPSHSLFQLATAELGWILPRGNSHDFQDASDLKQGRLRLVNRPLGAGARELLDNELERFSISGSKLPGYQFVANGHLAVADAVHNGLADVGVGHAGAAALYGLSFIPIQTEICTLVIPKQSLEREAVQVILQSLNSDVFNKELLAYGPYDTTNIGAELH